MIQKLSILILALLATQIYSIGIPIYPMNPRCLIAYTDDQLETLKLDINFPQLPNQVNGEMYQITVFNTETRESSIDTFQYGQYKKELELEEDHIYRICIKMMTNRQVGIMVIDYSAEVQYNYELSNVNVPETLLKDDDTKEAYSVAEKMHADLSRYITFTERRKLNQDQHFQDIISANDRMTTISYIELGLVICVGAYQFFMIRKFLVDKQYM